VDVIRREHLGSTSLVELCQGLERLRHQCAKELLQSVLDANPHSDVQGHACFALATLLKSQSRQTADRQSDMEAERLFERVVAEYGQVESQGKTLAERARPELSELRRLGIGKTAPEIEGEDLDGRKMKLSEYRGKVVVLTFWTTWCSACMEMVPHERRLVERMTGKPLALIGVNSDHDPAQARAAVEEQKITWRSFRDDASHDSISTAWNIRSWPAIYVLDRNGVIRYRDVRGPALDDAVDALMQEAE
jgi:peroxiredoxin